MVRQKTDRSLIMQVLPSLENMVKAAKNLRAQAA